MTKRMLIDATHAEETRVVVLDGNRLEDFDVETSTKRQLKGNIYLAKIVRVEPSLQAAFVEYGGNRHGFLAFGEIHPDYYQIPVADRQRLIAAEAAAAREEAEAEEREDDASAAALAAGLPDPFPPETESEAQDQRTHSESSNGEGDEASGAIAQTDEPARGNDFDGAEQDGATPSREPADPGRSARSASAMPVRIDTDRIEAVDPVTNAAGFVEAPERSDATAVIDYPAGLVGGPPDDEAQDGAEAETVPYTPPPETVGGEADLVEEARERRPPPRFTRNYKIQEVIHRRQIMLIQVVKEERGTKGAALTTFLSLAGRYCVLMPNSPRGGGISRKITSAADRKRLKEITTELDIPDGMGLIVRTAGAQRPKPEIKRDCEYLLRLWDDIRDHTMKSVAPALIYEEASLIKRAIRDVYSRDVDEVQVDGEPGWRAAHEFMRMLMPTHAKKVQLWRDPQPLFAKMQVEPQLDAMMLPTVQLRSGGYLVINQAEALVAIDVNSGRSTRERGIEETALRTNLEAADEVARQLRLRDLAGLIVIDFIDMESKKHNGMVERRLKDALKNDRARIQVGHISHFGLLEMSRQRLRPSLAETSFVTCPQCGGTGHVRGTESAAIHVLRGIEEEGAKRRSAEIIVHVAASIAMYLLNYKRERLAEIEARYGMRVTFAGDDALMPPQIRIERLRAQAPDERVAITPDLPPPMPTAPADAISPADPEDAEDLEDEEDEAEPSRAPAAAGEAGADDDRRPRRRRRRRRGGRRDETAPAADPAVDADQLTVSAQPAVASDAAADVDVSVEGSALATADGAEPEPVPEQAAEAAASADEEARARRRGRRGGRRRRRDDAPAPDLDAEQPELPPAYSGPTPANPFGGQNFDIFDLIDGLGTEPPPARVARSVAVAERSPADSGGQRVAPLNGDDRVNGTKPDEADTRVEWAPDVPAPLESVDRPDASIVPDRALAPQHSASGEPDAAPSQDRPASEMPHADAAEQTEADDVATGEPAIKPILVGVDASEGERKRGWWRR